MAKFTFDTTKLKEQVEDAPLVAAAIGAALLGGAAKLMQANTDRKRAKTFAREVSRRERQDRRK
jgi:hypothetical protein